MAKKRDRTREALLSAAQELVLERGLAAISVLDVTERAGVALGTFYNYFRTREDVADAIAELLQRAYHADIDTVTAGLDDPARIFAASARQTLHWLTRGSDIGRLLFESGLPMLRYAVGVRVRAMSDLQAGVESGRFRIDDFAVTQSLIGGIVVGASIDLHFGGLDPDDVPAVVTSMLGLLGVPRARAARIARERLALRPAPTLPLRATSLLDPLEDDGSRVSVPAVDAVSASATEAGASTRRRPRRSRGAQPVRPSNPS